LLRKEPRTKTFRRYQATNSIRQVLRRMTDFFRFWCFQSGQSLKHREGTVYETLPEVCVVGRVNAGKSSLLQHLLSAGKMQPKRLASAAQRPGKTQGIDVFCVNRRFTIADTPGYGSASVHESANAVKEAWDEKNLPLLEEYLKTTKWLRAVVYTHDIAKDATPEDRKVLTMLRRHKVPVLVVFTKDDKVDSETHRYSRVRLLRKQLRIPLSWPHAHYTTRRGGYAQVFKNMFGTMLLGLLATESRADAAIALKTELRDIFLDYRDKWVPRPRLFHGKMPKERKSRTYPKEDVVYTDEDLREEEEAAFREERKQLRAEQEAAGYVRTLKDDIEEEAGPALTPRERRARWEKMLEAARA